MARTRQALIDEAGMAMHAYQRSTQAFDDAVARALQLNTTDLRCLDWLVDRPRSAGELAAATGLSSAATTTLIDRLERKGYVRRVADPADRRRVLVEMTPEGAQRIGRYYGPLVAKGAALFDGVPTEQIATLTRWLEAARELTDRHRQRVEKEARQT